jgi:hypothetical protein
MMKLMPVLLMLFFTLLFKQSDCPCEKFTFDESPRWGHMTVTVFEDKPIEKIRGRVINTLDEPVSDARVYVWRKPGDVSDKQFSTTKLIDEDRLFACKTSEDGQFCFDVTPAGKYVVCATGTGYNSTCSIITIDLNSERKGFDIGLEPGT